MRMSFAQNDSPMLIGVVREKTVRAALAAIHNCECHGATGIDLHLSCMDEEARSVEALRQVVEGCSLPILALNYNQDYELQPFTTDEETRVELLFRAAEAGAAAIDMQGYTYDLPSRQGFRQEFANLDYSFIRGNPKEIVVDPAVIVRQTALIDKIHGMGGEVLLSCHPGIPMQCEQVVDLALFLEKRNPDVIKIVTRCDNEDELAESFMTMITLKKEVRTRVHFHCAGKAGRLSRIMNPILGGYLIFCSDGYTVSSNFEQLDLRTAKIIIDNMKKIM